MKKTGFTLAEVLITLAIIGVVATMTLPALMNNTGEQQAKTALKKGINTLTEIAQTSSAIDGVTYSDLTVAPEDPSAANYTDEDVTSLTRILTRRGSVDLRTSDANQIFFRDGSSVIVNPAAGGTLGAFAAVGAGTAADTGTLLEDGLPEGYTVIYDTNGAKGPNILSNCQAQTGGAYEEEIAVEADAPIGTNEICTKQQRVIKDRFAVRLRGGNVEPQGDAAVWAFNN